tara:strand:- start:2587 stop:3834 length:1248 start_codon:yes stop_codon:yes gene_type:complete
MNVIEQIKRNYISQQRCDLITNLFGTDNVQKRNEQVIIYGAGSAGKEISECLSLHGITTELFCDSNPDKVGDELLGKPIISFEELRARHINKFIVVGVQKFKKIVYEKLKSNKFNRIGIIENDEQFYYYLQFSRWKIDISEVTLNSNKICKVFEMLADQKSRNIFISRLSILTSYADFASYKRYCQLCDHPQEYPEEKKVFASNFENQMYFNNDLVQLNLNEVNLIDCGAYNGDSFFEFQNSMISNQIDNYFVYCFEPDIANYQLLQKNLKDYKNVKLFNLGVWNKRATLNFASSNLMYQTESCVIPHDESSSKVIQSIEYDSSIECNSIDNLIYPEKVNIIKMDVEGSESNALLGASKTIKKYLPQLIISSYHKDSDMWDIPLLIKDISLNYDLYFRQFSFSFSETVLIAIPKK